jgi:hypothetical protein
MHIKYKKNYTAVKMEMGRTKIWAPHTSCLFYCYFSYTVTICWLNSSLKCSVGILNYTVTFLAFCPYRDPNSDPAIVQPLSSHYTDWAAETYQQSLYCIKIVSHRYMCVSSSLDADCQVTDTAAYDRFMQTFPIYCLAVVAPVDLELHEIRQPKKILVFNFL